MDHDHDIRTGEKRLPVTGLLVSSVSVVLLVNVTLQAKFLGDSHGLIAAVVIDQYLDIDCVRELPDGFLQCLFRVIRGHDDYNAFSIDHLVFSRSKKALSVIVIERPAEEKVFVNGLGVPQCWYTRVASGLPFTFFQRTRTSAIARAISHKLKRFPPSNCRCPCIRNSPRKPFSR